jgi:hypothetical protein
MFIVPIKLVNERQKNMQQTYILTETMSFVDGVCNKGIIYEEAYIELVKKLQITNNIYYVKIQHTSQKNEVVDINYTNQVLESLESEGSYKMKKNDLFRVEVLDIDKNVVIYYGSCVKDEDY